MGQLAQTLARWGQALLSPEQGLHDRYAAFRALLSADERSLLLVAELEEIFAGARQVDPARTRWLCARLSEAVGDMVARLLAMRPGGYPGLAEALDRVRAGLAHCLPPLPFVHTASGPFILPLAQALGRPDLTGGKAANLAAAQRAGLSVPPGLVATTGAFQHFLDSGKLRPRLDRLLRQVDLSRPERIGPLCAGMQALVLGAAVPDDLALALRQAADALTRQAPELSGGRLAVRSSAVAEDGEASFAGQYASELGVRPEDVVDAYRRVVAAKYRPRAVTYRVRLGLPDDSAPMAVLLLPMIRAAAAGVLHSMDSRADSADGVGGRGKCMTVYALPGQGGELVAGRAEPRMLKLPRQLPALVLSASGKAEVELGPAVLSELVLAGLMLESTFGRPQEVEWAVDVRGRLFILQTRAQSAAPEPQAAQEVPEVVLPDGTPAPDGSGGGPGAQILAKGLSLVAPGLGCGPVYHLEPGGDLARVPAGCVLAVDSLTPALARCADRVAAVAARSGSRASHFGSVARESGLPVVSGLTNLRAGLPEGLLVTVDAEGCRVLAGCAETLRDAPRRRRDEERQRLAGRYADLARQTCRLGLTDPEAPDFAPGGCASLHDLVRFCHEMSVAEMAGLAGGPRAAGRGMGRARRLKAGLPLSLYLLDLGGGLSSELGARSEIAPEALLSAPMRALWQGLACSGEVWDDTGFACDWQEFDRISAGIFRKDSRLLASLALLSADYLHLLVRFGYHFAVLDCLCGDRPEANYASFRFKGGGGLPEQRRLRIVFLARVLAGRGFSVRIRGDMLEARLARIGAEELLPALTLLGRLLVRSQRLDLKLADEAQAERLAQDFLSACDGAR